jgi:hypothetical protein
MPAAASLDFSFVETKLPNEDNLNMSILNMATVVKNVVASVAESEVGACFKNAHSGASLRITLIELGHQQPTSPLWTDNSTSSVILRMRENLGDYHTKHHSAQHHKDMHGLILNQANSLQVLQECVNELHLG